MTSLPQHSFQSRPNCSQIYCTVQQIHIATIFLHLSLVSVNLHIWAQRLLRIRTPLPLEGLYKRASSAVALKVPTDFFIYSSNPHVRKFWIQPRVPIYSTNRDASTYVKSNLLAVHYTNRSPVVPGNNDRSDRQHHWLRAYPAGANNHDAYYIVLHLGTMYSHKSFFMILAIIFTYNSA